MNVTNEQISRFEAKSRNFKVLNGGDGTLVSEWRNHRKKALLPLRNYGMCERHVEEYSKIFDGVSNKWVKQFLYPTIGIYGNDRMKGLDTEALAEILFMNRDITQCMRTNVYINRKLANANVLSSGILLATKLGSTGYFKSIARTIFREGIGLAFVSPTYSIPNIVLNQSDKVRIEFVRNTTVDVACDKLKYSFDVKKGETFDLMGTGNNVSVFGYDMFMCEECRRNRNSTTVNDSYMVH